ncbi:MAG: DNA internalization-related competence protein ComEC/Rec2 [Ignavibacteria bacterium]|jgi:competence protein ComEC|nr:DNA internalization-related competence protein ComEC/Rec2 [Ignavibacteria bacterium]MCU7504040.1 DNA internalization-related competence protein ComEC/Rec2 [Ignavibacteria bacterium]MCU7515412.1 DNA internalization-related competence protein ComEC/Rec2 [Ignavibacteria bacterium]
MKDYPVIRICLLFMSGIILQKLFAIDTTVLFCLLAISFIIPAVLFALRRTSENVLLLILFPAIMLSGALSYGFYQKALKPYPFKVAKLRGAVIWGKIRSIELKRDFELKFLLEADSLKYNSRSYRLPIQVICRIRDENRLMMDSVYERLRPGQFVSLKGTFSKGRQASNPGEFDYQAYLEERGISAIHTAYNTSDFAVLGQGEFSAVEEAAFIIRKSMDGVFTRYHTKNCAALLRGFLLADRSEVGEEVQNDFLNTGVVHILAVSGSNVLLITMIFSLMLGRLNVFIRSFLTILGLFIFLIITGTSPSVFRAVIMAAVTVVAFLCNRSRNVFNLLAIAALIILAFNPHELFDAGFQLSFSSVLSIVVIYPHLKSLAERLNIESVTTYRLLLFILVTFSAQIGVLPFTLYYFGKVSVVSLPANLLVIPLSGAIAYIGIVTLLFSYFSPWLASIYAAANNFISGLLVQITHVLGGLRYSYLSIGQFTLQDLIISCCLLMGYLVVIKKLDSLKAKFLTALLVTLNIFIFCSLDDKNFFPENELSLLSLDVGQGDATLIRFPDNTTALIDAGGANAFFDSGEDVILPLLDNIGIEKIDYGFISHVDNDHYSGFISLINKGLIRKLFKPAPDKSYPKDISLERFLKNKMVPVLYYRKGILKLGNARVYVLAPEKGTVSTGSLNDRSGVMKIVYGKTSFLFEGDAGKLEEGSIVKKYGTFLKSDVLKLGHHGSRFSSSEELLRCVKPDLGLISCGLQNRFGHPSKEVLQRSRNFQIRILRTDLQGAIFLRSDGRQIKTISWKG